jgi:phytoene synthase
VSSELQREFAACAAVTRDKAKSFHFASRFLPPHKRQGVFALYDFCRCVDDLVDERGERPIAEVDAELDALEAMLRGFERGDTNVAQRWRPLAETISQHAVPVEPLLGLIEGIRGDLRPRDFQTTPELLQYCFQVAGVVGLALGPLLGAGRPGLEEAGAALGIAMQLTNVLRDVGADAALGRVYLPQDELERFDLSKADVLAGRVDARWRALMAFQIQRARLYYAQGDKVIPLFPQDGSRLTVRLMQRTYAGILQSIERQDFDVFRSRAHVGRVGKIAILAGALWSELPRAHERSHWGLEP